MGGSELVGIPSSVGTKALGDKVCQVFSEILKKTIYQ